MPRRFASPVVHLLLLLAVAAALTLPILGAASLWDIDEGLNAEAAREMLEADNWVVPTFNYQLRTSKPALLYWCQILAYRTLGVNEFAARLPSVLAGLAAVLLTYLLGRQLFDGPTGLLAGLALAAGMQFAVLAHAATPDCLLLAATTGTFLAFWSGYRRGRVAWGLVGAAMGLATLAKGPVGLVLPAGVIFVFLTWDRGWRTVLRPGYFWSWLTFAVVALPWYVLVGLETHGEFVRAFLGHDNLHRFLKPLEAHAGPFWFYLPVLLVGFAPWSVFLGPTIWYAVQALRRGDGEVRGTKYEVRSTKGGSPDLAPPVLRTLYLVPRTASPYRFLACWIVVYLVCFSVAATKLPNYVLPVYPALALLTGRFLERWRRADVQPAGWVVVSCLAGLVLTGVATSAGLAVAGGMVELSALRGKSIAGLQHWAWLGLVPIVAAVMALLLRRRTAALVAVAVGSVAFVGLLAGVGPSAVEDNKAVRALVAAAGACRPDEEVRVATFDYDQPSLVFYCQREVRDLPDPRLTGPYLAGPLPVYLFIPAATYQQLRPTWHTSYRELAHHRDLYRGCDVVVVTNR